MDWLIDWSIDWFNDPLIDWSIDSFNDPSIDWLIHWLIDSFYAWLIDLEGEKTDSKIELFECPTVKDFWNLLFLQNKIRIRILDQLNPILLS